MENKWRREEIVEGEFGKTSEKETRGEVVVEIRKRSRISKRRESRGSADE